MAIPYRSTYLDQLEKGVGLAGQNYSGPPVMSPLPAGSQAPGPILAQQSQNSGAVIDKIRRYLSARKEAAMDPETAQPSTTGTAPAPVAPSEEKTESKGKWNWEAPAVNNPDVSRQPMKNMIIRETPGAFKLWDTYEQKWRNVNVFKFEGAGDQMYWFDEKTKTYYPFKLEQET